MIVLRYLRDLFVDRRFLWMLFWINLLGTVYGYYWYRNQLLNTPPLLWPFVPDSPTSSLFFTIVILLWLFRRSSPVLEMMAVMTSFKYGVWCVAVLLLYGVADRFIAPANIMLILLHAGMAVEVLLYRFAYRFRPHHVWWGAAWLLLNDLFDYGFGVHPYLEDDRFVPEIAVFTVLLSLFTIALALWMCMKRPPVS
ncbi:DUF1405 domain-containing protein [Effusibacillus pohliae]|uniref:DUF1405 domain-containing protein n=1 Tax=Effusibacillus pohliae TaxID=232270 RepID=UPI00036F286D|nr:DUF1405 domain-containing protein [Effusibacillus pohliae]